MANTIRRRRVMNVNIVLRLMNVEERICYQKIMREQFQEIRSLPESFVHAKRPVSDEIEAIVSRIEQSAQ